MKLKGNVPPAISTAVIGAAAIVAAMLVWPSGAELAAGTQLTQEHKMDNNWNSTTAVTPRIDAQQPQQFETATFAVG